MAPSTIATSCNRFLNEMCTKWDLDISNNRRIELFIDIVVTGKVLVNEEMLDYLGYSGQYSRKVNAFARLLLKNPKINYEVILDENDKRNKNYILNGIDFELLIMRMRTRKKLELQKLISLIKSSSLTCYKKELKRTVDVLRNDIAPRVTPEPINKDKIHCLGLFATPLKGEWYLTRRQLEAWDRNERFLQRRGMRQIQMWRNVAHAIDIGNNIKLHYRELSWYAKDNIIKMNETANEPFDDDDIERIVTSIVEKENVAHELASTIEALIQHGHAPRGSQ